MKSTYMYVIGIIVIFGMLGVGYLAFYGASTPVVANGDNVSVYFTGTLTNGTVFDSNVGQQPFNFTVGANEVIPGFDQAVIGMKLHQEKRVVLSVNESYGPINPNLIVQVPLTQFGNNTVQMGMTVTEDTNGQESQGRIIGLNSTTAIVDFNSPLAGQILVFNITVAGIYK